MKTVVAIDLGAGNTKVIASIDNKIVKRLTFPSAVGLENHGPLSSFRSDRDAQFEVRPNVLGTTLLVSVRPDQQVPDHRRAVPSDDYQTTKQHDALMAAALHSTGVSHIDVLIVGTPVHTYQKHSKALRKWKGMLNFFSDNPIEIRNVLVVPQPYGALLAGLNEHILERGENINHCLIDVGYYSTDTLTTKGLFIDQTRSFGSSFGTAAIYQRIADLIAADLRMPVSDLDRIEYSLRTGLPYTAHGHDFDLKSDGYLVKVQQHVEAQITEIYGRLGTTEDIASILVTGGGSTLFESAVRKVFRFTRVMVMPDPVHANVRGYMVAGQAAAL